MTGLVLCGGQSSRLGFPKMLIERDGFPLYQWWTNALASVCDDVLISCTPEQTSWLKAGTVVCMDLKADQGPLMGILSAFRQHKAKALLAVSCELVYVGIKEMTELAQARDPYSMATAWMDPQTGKAYPLFTIYESNLVPDIEKELFFGKRSPSKVLADQKIHLIKFPADFRGINTREDLNNYLSI